MSNYLRGINRVVGFTDDTARGGALGEQGDAESWDAVSRMSSRGEVNNLRGARGPGLGLPPGGGARTPAGNNYPIASTFCAFAFMKGKSPAVHMAHSVGQFFGMSGLAVDVQGKLIGSLETGEMEDIQSCSSYHHKMHGPGQRSSTSTIPQGLSSTTKTNKIGTNYGQQEWRTTT